MISPSSDFYSKSEQHLQTLDACLARGMILLAFFYFVPFLQLSSAKTCKQTDSRGVLWIGEEEEIVVKSCSFDGFTLTGNATWRCDGDGHFDSQEPDRRDCVSSEISEAIDVEGLLGIIEEISLHR